MVKNQKHFSALECEICKFRGKCRYRELAAEMYRTGCKVPVKECRRLNPKVKVVEQFAPSPF